GTNVHRSNSAARIVGSIRKSATVAGEECEPEEARKGSTSSNHPAPKKAERQQESYVHGTNSAMRTSGTVTHAANLAREAGFGSSTECKPEEARTASKGPVSKPCQQGAKASRTSAARSESRESKEPSDRVAKFSTSAPAVLSGSNPSSQNSTNDIATKPPPKRTAHVQPVQGTPAEDAGVVVGSSRWPDSSGESGCEVSARPVFFVDMAAGKCIGISASAAPEEPGLVVSADGQRVVTRILEWTGTAVSVPDQPSFSFELPSPDAALDLVLLAAQCGTRISLRTPGAPEIPAKPQVQPRGVSAGCKRSAAEQPRPVVSKRTHTVCLTQLSPRPPAVQGSQCLAKRPSRDGHAGKRENGVRPTKDPPSSSAAPQAAKVSTAPSTRAALSTPADDRARNSHHQTVTPQPIKPSKPSANDGQSAAGWKPVSARVTPPGAAAESLRVMPLSEMQRLAYAKWLGLQQPPDEVPTARSKADRADDSGSHPTRLAADYIAQRRLHSVTRQYEEMLRRVEAGWRHRFAAVVKKLAQARQAQAGAPSPKAAAPQHRQRSPPRSDPRPGFLRATCTATARREQSAAAPRLLSADANRALLGSGRAPPDEFAHEYSSAAIASFESPSGDFA
ncbi:hypothetical protein DIPPA_09917, partial [Diplonema papillatum]